jgi:hypothetical protein
LTDRIGQLWARIRPPWSRRTKALVLIVGIEVLVVAISLPIILAVTGGPDTPTHLSRAAKALDGGNTDELRSELRDARDDSSEAKQAQEHADAALGALQSGQSLTLRSEVVDGAATESFTNALRKMRDGDVFGEDGAKHYLHQAEQLTGFSFTAQRALAAIDDHDLKTAKAVARQGVAAAA